MGGYKPGFIAIDEVEVFDSKTKEISKVLDDKNNWVKIPVADMAGDGFAVCSLPLADKNAFIICGGM